MALEKSIRRRTFMEKRRIVFGVSLLLTLGAIAATAQMGTGRVSGTLKDPQGKPIVGGKITATSPDSDKALEATSDKDGKWAVLGFRSGTYEFSFNATGFAPMSYKNAVKQMGRNPAMDVVLEPLKAGQTSGGMNAKLTEANALFEQKQYQQAIAGYEEVLAAEPTVYQIHLNIGAAYRELHELDKAAASFQKVLEQDATNTAAQVNLGEVLVEQGKLDEAVTYFEKAIGQTQDEVIPFNVAEIYFNQNNAAKAIEYYQIASQRKPAWPEPYLKLGYAHLNAGNMDAAKASFQKVLEVAPDSPQAQMAQQALSMIK
jgi:tetratricopeptide (TPR) repeat protein